MADPTVVTLLMGGLSVMTGAVVAMNRQGQKRDEAAAKANAELAAALHSLREETRHLTDNLARLATLVDERIERRGQHEPIRFPERRTGGRD